MAPAPGDPAVPFDRTGPTDASRLVLLHGFTQNRHCWGPLPRLLGDDREVLIADAPGHGDAAGLAWSLAEAAGPYADALAGDRPATWLGYSMGGRLALHVAITRPAAVEALVLVGASPGIADAADRAERRAADDALADHLEHVGTETFVDEWLDQPLFDGLDESSSCRAERLSNDPAGLASSLRLAGTGAQDPLWDSLGTITVPVLLVVGERDAKFRSIADAMGPQFGGTWDLAVIAGAGHACHLEAPERFSEAVCRWIDGVVTVGDRSGQAGTP